jgi:hypothetical protein
MKDLSKNGKREEVKIMQKWDGNRPNIKPLLFRFDLYLHVLKSQKLHHHKPNVSKCRTIVYSTDWPNKEPSPVAKEYKTVPETSDVTI